MPGPVITPQQKNPPQPPDSVRHLEDRMNTMYRLFNDIERAVFSAETLCGEAESCFSTPEKPCPFAGKGPGSDHPFPPCSLSATRACIGARIVVPKNGVHKGDTQFAGDDE